MIKRSLESRTRRNHDSAVWRAANPTRARAAVRESNLKKKFGLTVSAYDAMFLEQGGLCGICRQACKSGRRLAVDHCHQTKRVRGLLCMNCNRGIGYLQDNADLLERAAAYIKRNTK